MALVYATGGSVEEMEAVCVDMVSSVVTPSATRAGTAYNYKNVNTGCSRSSDPVYIVTYYIKWVTSSWTCSILMKFSAEFILSLIFRGLK